ncbi:hypothetical protein D3C73_1173930 [compost metagenome]
MVIIRHFAMQHFRIPVAGVIQKLLYLMAADIAQNAAVLLPFEEPAGPACRVQAVWPRPDYLKYPADRSLLNQVTGIDRTFHMQPFTEISHIFTAGLLGLRTCGCKLLKASERSLVCKIIFTVSHHFQP